MKKKTIKSMRVANILTGNGRLREFSTHAVINRSLQRELDSILVEPLVGKCRVFLLKNKTLKISVRTSALATQLRLLAPTLVEKLRYSHNAHTRTITKIQVRMNPATSDLLRKPEERQLPDSIKARMATLSHNLQDAKLRQCLQRIANK